MNPHMMVLEILNRAVSQDTNILKPAEQALQNLETTPGFYAILKDVFCNESINVNVRLLAILYFKNGVDKYWRSNAPNAISEDEKSTVRQSLHYILNEKEKILATHLAVLVAKIARFDCPNNWQELIPELLKGIKSEGNFQHRSLMVLHQVVKTLSTKRLSFDRKIFQDLATFLYRDIYECWEANCLKFLNIVQQNELEAERYLEKGLLSLKILENLTVRGFKQPHEHPLVDIFLKTLIERSKVMLQIRVSVKMANLVELASKYVVRSTNILQNLLELHPVSFVEYIRITLEYIILCTFTPEGEKYLFERFLLQCFNLIKLIVLSPGLRIPRFLESKGTSFDDSPTTCTAPMLRARQLKLECFTEDTLTNICRKLITHYFLLTKHDIELWATDPETYAVDESGETWKYALRPSTETLFSALFTEFQPTLVPVVVDLVRQNEAIVPPDNIQAILNKDAVYNAVGIAAFDLYDQIDFDSWLQTTLIKEIRIPDDNYRIIRRRVAWLIGSWTGVKLSPSLHPMVYSTMIDLLKPEEDMVVQLTAANTIRITIDGFGFDIETFLNYLEPTFTSLFALLRKAEQCDTKMRILHVLYFVIERADHHIIPYYNKLVEYLPILWQESEPHNMLRCAVVVTLGNIVKAIGKNTKFEEMYTFIFQVISISTDVNENCYVYLLEDGLALWQAVVENSPCPNPALMALFKNMPNVLENNADLLPSCISIITAYTLLAPNELLQAYGEKLVYILKDIMTDMKPEGLVLVLKLLELFIKVNSAASCILVKPVLPKIMESVLGGNNVPKVMALHLSILARVLWESKDIFIEVVSVVSSTVYESKDDVLNKFIDVWLENMPMITKVEKSKMLALALSSLLTTNPRFVYNKFCGILLAVSEVMADLAKINSSMKNYVFNAEGDSGGDSGDSDDDCLLVTEQERRIKQLSLKDPVYTISLENYFRTQIFELKKNLSATEYDQFVQSVDAETLAQVRVFVPL